MVLAGKNMVEIGINLNADGFAGYFSRCSIQHITRLEDFTEAMA